MGRNHGGFYQTPQYIEKQRDKKIGNKNPNWKNGNSYTFQYNFYGELAKSLKQSCSLCGSKDKLLVHHLDGNYKNNISENITIVCRGCHNKIHKSKGDRNDAYT